MRLIFLLLLTLNTVFAQKPGKGDKKLVAGLKENIHFLADDRLEGRRAGTPGEKIAADYISGKFAAAGLERISLQEFPISEKREAAGNSLLIIDNKTWEAEKDFAILSISGSKTITSSFSLSLPESGAPWFHDIGEELKEQSNNPHFNISQAIRELASSSSAKGASCLFIYDGHSPAENHSTFRFEKNDSVGIPVVYLFGSAVNELKKDSIGFHDLSLHCEMKTSKRTGTNVFGGIWNNATETVVLGAHYDHLGYGEDKNSMYTGTERMIHNGADDNASGTAALIELAGMIKKAGLKRYNYLFVAFSGEELGLFGSKYFVDNLPEGAGKINYMINMDMLGRLRDSSKMLTLGGYGTSPEWPALLPQKMGGMMLKIDSSGSGPSDHTSFYRKDIPVLFFFTGLHGDYHKPSDDADKINYEGELAIVKLIFSIVKKADGNTPLVFTKTREKADGKTASFKVTMGIMPDYTYSGTGVRADGVSEGRPAQKAGIKAGDIIVGINDYGTEDIQKYMEALGKFSKGDRAKVTVKRGGETLFFDIAF